MSFDPSKIAIALINSDASQLNKDRQVLHKLGFSGVQQYSSYTEAIRYLPDARTHLILVGDKAGDRSGLDCLRAIKQNPALKSRAVVMISAESRRERVLAAVSAGCGGYVLRPYLPDTFVKHLKSAWESTRPEDDIQAKVEKGQQMVWAGQFGEAVEELTQVTSGDNDALEWFNKGLEHLRKQEFGQAIQAFNRSLAANTLFAEAYRGLAYAHQGLGDPEKHLEYLKKSAEILAMQDKLDELRELYVEILSHDPEAVNPYNTLGVKLRRSGDLPGALHAYNRALTLTPSDENLHYNIAKAYTHASRKDLAKEHLQKALEINPDFTEAEEMLGQLTQED